MVATEITWPLDVPSADVTVTGAVGSQSFGPRSWPGARPWGDPRARRAEVEDIRVSVAGARPEDGERVGAEDRCV